MKYSAGQRETWAIVAAKRKWHDYLKGDTRTIVLTDHNPLSWFRRHPDFRHTFERLIMELEDLDCQVRYRRGRDNCVADCLRRPSSVESETDYDNWVNDESPSRIDIRCYNRKGLDIESKQSTKRGGHTRLR